MTTDLQTELRKFQRRNERRDYFLSMEASKIDKGENFEDYGIDTTWLEHGIVAHLCFKGFGH